MRSKGQAERSLSAIDFSKVAGSFDVPAANGWYVVTSENNLGKRLLKDFFLLRGSQIQDLVEMS